MIYPKSRLQMRKGDPTPVLQNSKIYCHHSPSGRRRSEIIFFITNGNVLQIKNKKKGREKNILCLFFFPFLFSFFFSPSIRFPFPLISTPDIFFFVSANLGVHYRIPAFFFCCVYRKFPVNLESARCHFAVNIDMIKLQQRAKERSYGSPQFRFCTSTISFWLIGPLNS